MRRHDLYYNKQGVFHPEDSTSLGRIISKMDRSKIRSLRKRCKFTELKEKVHRTAMGVMNRHLRGDIWETSKHVECLRSAPCTLTSLRALGMNRMLVWMVQVCLVCSVFHCGCSIWPDLLWGLLAASYFLRWGHPCVVAGKLNGAHEEGWHLGVIATGSLGFLLLWALITSSTKSTPSCFLKWSSRNHHLVLFSSDWPPRVSVTSLTTHSSSKEATALVQDGEVDLGGWGSPRRKGAFRDGSRRSHYHTGTRSLDTPTPHAACPALKCLLEVVFLVPARTP